MVRDKTSLVKFSNKWLRHIMRSEGFVEAGSGRKVTQTKTVNGGKDLPRGGILRR